MLIYRKCKSGSYIRMDVKAVRKIKLQRLVAGHRSMREAADVLGLDYQVVYQLTHNAKRSTGKPYQMGDDIARKIEDKLGKNRGWMDSLVDELSIIEAETMEAALDMQELSKDDRKLINSMIKTLKTKTKGH